MLSHHPGCPRAPAINVVDRTGIRTEMAVFFEGCARQSYATTLNQGDGGLERFFGVMVAAWLFFLKNIFGFMDVRAHAGGNNFCI